MCNVILCIATLDSKGAELQFIKQVIERHDGFAALVMDISCQGSSPFPADITSEEIAKMAGSSIQEVRQLTEAGPAAEIMAAGAKRAIRKLYAAGKFDAVLTIGGGMGSEIASAAMRELPIGLPKLMLSSQKVVQAGIRRYVESKDIVVFPSTADIAGLNRLTKDALRRSVGAVIGMLSSADTEESDKPLVFMTMTGLTNSCGLAVKSILENNDYEVVVFPAIGIGGITLEELVRSYPVSGVIELAINEIGNELFGGMASAGPNRLEAAGELGIPQIITPGCSEVLNFLSPDTLPDLYRDRPICYHNPQATLPRLNGAEMSQIAEAVARKLNRSNGRVKVLIPLGGFSALDKEGMEFHDPDADKSFVDTLKSSLDGRIEVTEVDAHINENEFAEVVAAEFIAFFSSSGV